MKKSFSLLLILISAFFALSAPAYAQAPPAGSPAEEFWNYLKGPGLDMLSDEAGDGNKKKSLDAWKRTFSDESGCWGCALYSASEQVTREVGRKGQDIFTGPAINALQAFMGLWVVWQLFLLLSPSNAHNPSQTLDNIFQKLVLMVILLFLLKWNGGPYDYLFDSPGYVKQAMDGIMASANQLVGSGGRCGGDGGVQLICSMHIEMGKGMGVGAFLMDDANMNPFGDFEVFQMFGGMIIFLAYAMMMIMLPFRLFDALIRIAIVAIVLPVAILAYQFKPTRGFSRQSATSVVAAALTFLFTAIAVAISTALLRVVTTPVIDSVVSDRVADGYVGPLSGSEFMVLVASAIGMAAFIKQAGSLASEFTGFQGQMGNVGNAGAAAVGTTVTAAVGAPAAMAAYKGYKAAGGAARAVGGGAARAGRAAFRGASGGGDGPSAGSV